MVKWIDMAGSLISLWGSIVFCIIGVSKQSAYWISLSVLWGQIHRFYDEKVESHADDARSQLEANDANM